MIDQIPVYLPFALYDRLRVRADREHTTVNSLVCRILTDTLGPPEEVRRPDRVVVP